MKLTIRYPFPAFVERGMLVSRGSKTAKRPHCKPSYQMFIAFNLFLSGPVFVPYPADDQLTFSFWLDDCAWHVTCFS